MSTIDPERLRRAFVAVGLEITDLSTEEAQTMIDQLIEEYDRLAILDAEAER